MKIIEDNCPTWEELVKMKQGTIIKQWEQSEIQCLIVRGASGLCAYFGINLNHPLTKIKYEDINLNCHGGVTYSGIGEGTCRSEKYYWIGWDYSHAYDYSFYYDEFPLGDFDHSTDKKWLPKEVEMEMKQLLPEFKELMLNSEQK